MLGYLFTFYCGWKYFLSSPKQTKLSMLLQLKMLKFSSDEQLIHNHFFILNAWKNENYNNKVIKVAFEIDQKFCLNFYKCS